MRALATSGPGVETVQALAGTGKTTMLRALADAYADAGVTVFGAAPTARAARELRDAAGVDAGTLHALAGVLDRRGGFPRGSVLLLDEAGMAATRISARVFAHAERAGVKVIAVGDAGQLSSVEAGGWFAALTRTRPGPSLRDVIRQRDPAERAPSPPCTTASQSATSTTKPTRSRFTPPNGTRSTQPRTGGSRCGPSTARPRW